MHAELAAAPHPLVGPATWSVGRIDGGTGASIVRPTACVDADRRLLPGESEAAVLADLSDRIDGLELDGRGLTVELTMPMEHAGFRDACGPPAGRGDATALWPTPAGLASRSAAGRRRATAASSPATSAYRSSSSAPARSPARPIVPTNRYRIDELVVAARTYALTALRLLT